MNNITFLSKVGSICLFFLLSIGSGWAQCMPPTVNAATAVNQISATISWTAIANAIDYETELRTDGAAGSGSTDLFLASTTSLTSISYTGLTPNQTYSFYIRSRCAGDNSAWSTATIFTTVGLTTPVAVDPSDVTNSSYVARWEASVGATFYEIQHTLQSDLDWSNAQTLSTNGVLNRLVFGLIATTPYKYRVRARAGAGAFTEWSNEILFSTTAIPVTIARFTSEGWLAQPTENVHLSIEANFNTASDDFGTQLIGKSLTVAENITFTIAPTTFVRVFETITNNSTPDKFVLHSNANLNQRSPLFSNVGAITVMRDSYPINRLDYTMWSSPVFNQNLLAFSPETNTTRFYNYNSADNNFNTITNPESTVFEPGEGYLIRAPNTWVPYAQNPLGQKWPGKFIGIPNLANVTVNLDPGFNMVGNPFPTDIAATALLGANGGIDKTLYFWRRKNNNVEGDAFTSYYAVLGANGPVGVYLPGQLAEDSPVSTRPNGIIKVGQGFVVRTATTAASTITFTHLMKRDNNFTDKFLKNSSNPDDDGIERHKFYLHLTGAPGIGSEILLAYTGSQESSDGIDNGDAPAFGDGTVGLSYLIEDQSFVIQGKPLPFEQTDEIALRLQTIVAATYTISLNDVTGMFTEAVDPILIDMLTNTETNLRNGSYTFATEAGTFDARFKIVFVENYLSNNDVAANANAVFVISKDNVLSVNAGTYTINNIDIFDIQGRKIYSKENVDASSTSISDLRAKNQIILVQIATDHGVVTKKVQF